MTKTSDYLNTKRTWWNSLNLKKYKLCFKVENVRDNNVLVSITASRVKEEIVYSVDCASNITNEELEYYLGEIVNGICKWKKGICEENIRSFEGKIAKLKK
jgi:hypothetical protein